MEDYNLISPKKLVVFGASNSGKSTFTEFFCKKKVKEGDKENKSKSTDNGKTKIINIA